MHLIDGRLLLSPSDLVAHLACAHLTQLELAVSRGELTRPPRVDPELDMLARKGQEHEEAHLERLRAERGEAVEIGDHGETLDGLRRAEAETVAAMRAGAAVIYQATFFDGRWRGRADYLLRVDVPSQLGPWSYEVADAKLARSVKVAALIQMCEYSHQVHRLQGRAPELMHVILGTGVQETHRVADYDAYFRAARTRYQAVVDAPPQATYPDPVDHCRICAWAQHCDRRRRDDDHLCLVAGMRLDQTRRLHDRGITTVMELAEAAPEPVAGIGDASLERLRRQAALQVEERISGVPLCELLDCEQSGLGLAALPQPSDGDLFFDMEGDPFVEDGGLEYLFGITELVGGAPRFRPVWGHDPAAEKAAFEAVVDLIIERLEADPAMHVYHYAQYEPAALKKLMGRHATREEEVDRLLRAGVFVDLYQVVRQGVRVSRESYSLKSLEVFFMAPRTEDIADAVGSIVAYERWRETGDNAELDSIAAYNQRDCESTWRLRDWLEARRDQWAVEHGGALPRPQPESGAPSEALLQAIGETEELADALTADIPLDAGERTADQSARWLLAQLLDWHRREDKSAWWTFFERLHRTDDELVDDAESIGNVVHVGAVGEDGRSVIHRYSFDGTQEHKLDVGDTPCDPRTGRPAGTVHVLHNDAGIVELRRGPNLAEVAHPRSLIPSGPIPTTPLRDALRRLARAVIAEGTDAPVGHRAALDLLLRRPPRVGQGQPDASLLSASEDPSDGAVRVVSALDGSCLAIQGPPGSGKTHTGARIVLDQVQRRRRVGVTATTHRAIGELLDQACALAAKQGIELRVLQKCSEDERCPAPAVRRAASNADVEDALHAGEVDVVAGTPWLFAHAPLTGLLDVLVVDEAGQMSLANAVAVAAAARNLVLLGDPQQLAQPGKGIHPPGAAVSSLEHLLDSGRDTIPEDRGVFLATSRRMHPDVCAFISTAFYEGRLRSHPGCARQRIDGDGELAGTGLRLAAVAHSGNRTWSPEEVRVVRRLVDALLETTWTDAHGVSHPVGLDDVLVVAPYNLHVRRLRDGLPAGARVGTVDRFQGQQAAATVYAMATSSAEDVPRNLEFVFSRNRLNVAVSRARALSVIVCSPLLLQAGCRTPEQLRLVSALCRFAEMASLVHLGAAAPSC